MPDKSSDPRAFVCHVDGCGKSFKRRDYLERHSANHSSTRPFTCRICRRGFTRADVLQKHTQRHQPQRSSFPSGETHPSSTASSRKRIRTEAGPVTRQCTSREVSEQPVDDEFPPAVTPNKDVTEQTEPTEFLDALASAAVQQDDPLCLGSTGSAPDPRFEDTLTWLFSSPDTYNYDYGLLFRPQTPTASASDLSKSQFPVLDTPTSVDTSAPVITESMREEMIIILKDEADVADFASSFTCKKLNLFVELYFIHFDPFYPVLHRPTLGMRKPSAYLLFAIVFIGTAFADDRSSLTLAKRFHWRLRQLIFQLTEENPRVDVGMLQSILLLNIFGRSFSDPSHHDSAQIFHSPSVMMAKFAGVLTKQADRENWYPTSYDGWKAWATDEERKRVGWLAFLSDTSNAAFYRHPLMIHVHNMSIDLPCGDEIWQASDILEWKVSMDQALKTPDLLHATKALIGRGEMPPITSNFVAWILLHALLCISWALLWRDLANLSMVSRGRIEGWKISMQRAFQAWQTFVGHDIATRSEAGHSFYLVGIPFSHTGTILLMTDTEYLRILAGAPRVAGRLIGANERTRVQRQLMQWAKGDDSPIAVWAALQSLKFVIGGNADLRIADAPATTPWCIYLAVLTCWAFGTILEGKADFSQLTYVSTEPEFRIEPSIARREALAYLNKLLQYGIESQLRFAIGKNEVGGILAYGAYLIGSVDCGICELDSRLLVIDKHISNKHPFNLSSERASCCT